MVVMVLRHACDAKGPNFSGGRSVGSGMIVSVGAREVTSENSENPGGSGSAWARATMAKSMVATRTRKLEVERDHGILAGILKVRGESCWYTEWEGR